MKRRDFLTLSAAFASIPFSLSAASGALPYSTGLVSKHLAAGDPVFLISRPAGAEPAAPKKK